MAALPLSSRTQYNRSWVQARQYIYSSTLTGGTGGHPCLLKPDTALHSAPGAFPSTASVSLPPAAAAPCAGRRSLHDDPLPPLPSLAAPFPAPFPTPGPASMPPPASAACPGARRPPLAAEPAAALSTAACA